MSETADMHKAEAPLHLRFAIITISTSRFERVKGKERVDDLSGELVVKLLRGAGHSVVSKEIISDDRELIKESLGKALENSRVDAVITCGGTGITPTDVTIETVEPLLEKRLPGFGEVFRAISYGKIGSPAILTRAIAGLMGGKAVFCLPGSPQAVETALRGLIIPEVGHIVKHARD